MIPGEDQETNPMRFGKAVAEWISEELRSNGFSGEVSPEDWGWRVECTDEPCAIWIGCGNVEECDTQGNFKEPDLNNLTWQCFVEADKPFLKSILKKIDPSNEINRISSLINALLIRSSHIEVLGEP